MASDKQLISGVDTAESLIREAITKVVAPSMMVSDRLDEWISKSNSVNILVAGKTGTGKSTLINGIIGKVVAKEGDNLTPETDKVQPLEMKIGDVIISIFDSPGLQDQSSNEAKYIADIQAKCGNNIDLFLYCIRMSEVRFTANCPDFIAMSTLTKALGPELWKNGLIVFTFANDVIEMTKHKPNVTEHFRNHYEKASLKLRKYLQEQIQLDPEIVSQVTIVCAGHLNQPTLPSVSDQVPGDCHWLSHLWLKALYKTKLKAQPAMVKINMDRIKNKEEYFPDEKQLAESEITAFPPIMLNQAGMIIGQEIGSERLGAVVGDATSQLMVSQIKSYLGIESQKSSVAVWTLISIAMSPEGPIMETKTTTFMIDD